MFLHLFNEQPPDFSTSQFTRLQNNDGRLTMVHFSTVKTIDFSMSESVSDPVYSLN